jgi:hypothetical protein
MKNVLLKLGKKFLVISSIALILAAALVTMLPNQAGAAYRIPTSCILHPVSPIVPGKQVFQTCLSNDTQWAYFVYTPPTYDSNGTKLWPMLIFHMVNEELYSGGENINRMYDSGRGGMNGGPLYDLEKTPKPAYLADRFIVITPFVDNFCNSHDGKPARLMGLYKYLTTHMKVDQTHISLMGDCAGGGMVVDFAEAYPTFPSSIVAMSCNDTWRSTVDLTKLCNIKNLPYQHYADQGDGMVPFSAQKAIYDGVVACGGTKMQFIVQNKGQHEIWGLSGLDTVKAMYDWMLGQQTPVAPKANEIRKASVSLNTLSAGDQVSVIGLNGQILYKSSNVSKLDQLLSNTDHGVRVVRVRHADGTVRQAILSKQ